MKRTAAALFDADGVLTLPEEFFSQMYARSRGLDPEPFEAFFKQRFPAARVGKADLKNLIENDQELWKWQGSTDELLGMWFESENVRNEPLIKLIQTMRAKGIPCFVATNQEKYRGQYMRDVMFKAEFDGFFISAELGVEKPEQEFFAQVVASLQHDAPDLRAENVVFFDDTPANVAAARQAGLQALQYSSLADVADWFRSQPL